MSKFKAYNGKDLPFSIYSSSVLTGYQEYVSGTFAPNVSFEGIQDDNYSHVYLEGIIQGTYSEQNVGGRNNHHIDLSSSYSRQNRPERYELVMYTGTLIVNSPTVGLPADRSYREPLTKRTFGFKNILDQNFKNNYEVVSTSGRSVNKRDFYFSGGYSLPTASELPYLNLRRNYNVGNRTHTGSSVIVTRFGLGDKKQNRDFESLEISAYNANPWKNWFSKVTNNHISSKVFMQGYEPVLRRGAEIIYDYNYLRGQNYNKLVNYVEHKINMNTQWSSKKSYPNVWDSNYGDLNGCQFIFYSTNSNLYWSFDETSLPEIDSHINKQYYCLLDGGDGLSFAFYYSLPAVLDGKIRDELYNDYSADYGVTVYYSTFYSHKSSNCHIEDSTYYYPNKFKKIPTNCKITNKFFTTVYVNQLSPIHDNGFITHQIPQNDSQYWWQHKSLNHSSSYYGYFSKDNPGVYTTASELQQQLWTLTSDDLNSYNTSYGNDYVSKPVVSFSNFSSYIKDVLDIDTNTLGYESSSNISEYRYIKYLDASSFNLIPTEQLRFLERSYISSAQKLATNVVKGCPEFFTALTQYRNGIYGWPSWKQYRTENILTRYQRNNNYINNRDLLFKEPAISYNKKCTNIIDGNVVSYTYANNKEHFSNEILERYSTNGKTNITLFDRITEKNIPIKNLKYFDLLYPDKLVISSKNIRIRDNFLQWWKNNKNNRYSTTDKPVEVKTVDGGTRVYYSSLWDLDERLDKRTNLYSGSVTYDGFGYYVDGKLQFPNSIFYNPLANYSYAPDGRGVGWGKTPIYARPTHSGSVFGKSYYGEDTIIFYDTKWETSAQSGRQPYYQTYEEYLEDIKPLTQNKSLLPEFRISEHIDYYLENGGDFFIKNDNFLSVNQSSISSSLQDTFYDIYSLSRSDSKNLELIKNKKVNKIELNCEGLIKFLPHKGFYPVERSVQCVDYFSGSYTYESTSLVTSDIFDRPVYTTLFSPGILYNTIKSGIAVDYPKAVYNIAITGSNGQNLDDSTDSIDEGFPRIKLSEDIDAFINRFPFETLLEPENYIDYTLDIEASPMSRMTGNYCENLKNISPIYQMSIHNFLAESINLFMKNGELSAFASRPQQKIVVDSTKKEYIMTLKMYSKPWETYEDYGITFVKPNFLMFSSGSAFGPPSDISDTYLHYHNYSCFTPPYFDHPNGAEIAFVFVPWKTSSNEYTLQEIVSNLKVIGNGDRNGSYYFIRNSRISSDTPDVPYHYGSDYSRQLNFKMDGSTEAQNWMQITSSLNYNIVENVKNVNYEALSGIPIDVQDNIDKQTWIIQTKFETPILNFYSCSVDASHIDTSSYSEQCVGALNRGMWLQYSRKLEDNEGIFLKIQDVISDYQSGYIHDNINTGSLADLVGFDKKEIRLGEVDNSKFIREAVVAIPYILEGNDKKYFYIKDIDIDKILNDDPRVPANLRNTAKSMKKYVFPPRYDWNMNKYKIGKKSGIDINRPFKMFVFEFEREFSSQDLLDIWQNVMPESYKDFKIQNRKVEIDVDEHPDILGQLDKVKWMIFKVKQKAEKNYYAKTANSSDDSRFSFELKYGNKGRKNFVPDYSYNWPYDWMSLVEFANIEMTVEAEEEQPNIPNNLRVQ